MSSSAIVTPIDGWGFMETIDGELSSPFEIELKEAGVDVGGGIRGWRGIEMSAGHKYLGMSATMTPRHVEWDGLVVLKVSNDDDPVFSGMADTSGLERNWA